MLLLILESALSSLILALIVWSALRVFRVRNRHTQSCAWRAVLVSSLVMPLLIPVLERVTYTAPSLAVEWMPVTPPLPVLEVLPFVAPPMAPSFSWWTLLMTAYVVVASALLLRLAAGVSRSRGLCRSAMRLNEPWMRGYHVRVSDAIRIPATVGSTILLPADWDRWSVFQQEAVLLHESCHVRRRDFYVHLIAGLHRAVFWFSPMAWWLQNRLVDLAESICDDAALRKVEDRVSYAEVLVKFAAEGAGARMFGMSMARGKTLGRRVERVMSETAVHRPASVVSRLLIVLLLVPVGGLAAGAWAAQARVVEPLKVRFQVAGQPAPTTAPSVPTQQPATPRQSVTPARVGAPSQVQETGNFLAKWPEREVPYIISPAERAAFETLKTDEEREAFIDTFWRLRDPSPGTVDNEFRDEYYRRIVYANDRFTARTGVPGWQSDRGRILIQLGKPDELENHSQATLELDRATGRVINTFPSEAWRYKLVEGLGQNQVFVFVDSTGDGSYRLQSDPAGKGGVIPVPPR